MKSRTRLTFLIVAACFFVSGAAGLIYQVVWSRYLALFLGHTSYAVMAVLVAFMGGLALGNLWFGRRADRLAKPLAFYGWLEIGIGVYAILFPTYYNFCHDTYFHLARLTRPGSTTLLAFKFLFSLLAILLPTVLMGATFPVLTRFVTRSLAQLRERVAALYALNSAGAVLGCLLADFWLIPRHGLVTTVLAGAVLNLLAGLAALIISSRVETDRAIPQPPSSAPEIANEQFSSAELRLSLIAIGLSGFAAMLYEVAWTRLLALALGSTTHAFSLMLMTFITGIAVGSAIICFWKGLRHTFAAFGWAEAALTATLFASLFYYEYLSFWFVKLAGILSRQESSFPVYQLVQALTCFAVMFLPTICLGMTLPLASRIATVELAQTGRSVGAVFAVNTLGTVLGTILTGLCFLPKLGLAGTFGVGIALNAMIAVAILRPFAGRKRSLLLPLLAGLAIVSVTSSELNPSWQRAFSMGLFRAPSPPETLAAFRSSVEVIPLKYHKDGASSTVDVYSWLDGTNQHLTLKINGKTDAGNQADMITQLMLGHLPLLLRPQSSQVLVIGLGSGITCGAVAQHPGIEAIDTVEISPEVVEAAHLFAEFNGHVLDNPKLHLAVDDAKSFLQITDQKYDLIISEPSNPWMAGVAGLFTKEYYQTCAAHLKPGGRIVQWMHFYETTDEVLNLVLRTLLSVFPYASLWQPATGDLIMIGGQQPLPVNLQATQRRFAEPAVKADLARAGLLTLATVLACEIVPQQSGFFSAPADGPIHSDFLPQLEYRAQRGFFLNRLAEHWRDLREDFSPRAATMLGEYLQTQSLTRDDLDAFVRGYQDRHMPDPRLFRSLLQRWQTNAAEIQVPLQLWASVAERTSMAELRSIRMAPLQAALMQEAMANAGPLRLYESDLMEAYRAQRSIFYLPPVANLESVIHRLLEADPSQTRIYKLHLAEIAWDKGEDATCLELGQSALAGDSTGAPIDLSLDPVAPKAVLYRMIESLLRAGKLGDAWGICQKANAGGYLDRAETVFPLLAADYRKAQMSVAQTPTR